MAQHVIVDGSNIATEGRSKPSLKQLNDAVVAFMAENPKDVITVVVDATFGHRIDRKEVDEFDEAIANNELVAPPAGTVGRGDAFVLMIAQKVGASILSNDSYQEFHGQYPWLFHEGRLIGGKPVPHVGWVFVTRTPVRGEKSRRSVQKANPKVSAEAMKPMPVPKAPPPGAVKKKPAKAGVSKESSKTSARTTGKAANKEVVKAAKAAAPSNSSKAVNDVIPFLSFLEKHPVGSLVKGIVESYSSHGAYVQIGDVRGYVPLRLISDPPPRSAREVMAIGDQVSLEVVSVVASRRSIDLKPSVSKGDDVKKATVKKGSEKKAAEKKTAEKKPPAKKTTAKKTAAKKSPAKKSPAKKAATEKPAVAKKAAAKKPAVAKKAAAKKPAVAKKSAGKTPAKKATPGSSRR